ncbi:MAG: type II toxin-antitoxin system prevent-host-death family antitoxin [Steroidobacteraceae bacterium]|jgi:prevent-host-death family protein|nr:type II toxin-antitoxin system prevent-host-death family antitoxin [Steroidobacteraceae bacterium]
MKSYGVFEAKTRFSELVDQAARGEEVLITRRGQPVARLVPAQHRDVEAIRRTIRGLEAFRERHSLDADWRELRDAGRKY